MEIGPQVNQKKAGSLDLALKLARDAMFPRFCVSCKEEGRLLCRSCRADWTVGRVPDRCCVCQKEAVFGKTCGACVRFDTPDGHLTTFSYADPIARSLIGAWKYAFDESAWEHLQTQMRSHLSSVRQCLETFGINEVTSVPLHHQRLCERGFDQAQVLANWIAHECGALAIDTLERTRSTGRQAQRSDYDRKTEMQEMPFAPIRGAYIPKKVLLVDDVWTTGSTARAAVRALRRAGVEEVWVYTIARG